MNIEKLYNSLDDNINPEINKNELITYLKSCAQLLLSDKTNRAGVAYEIAGLMSTKYARSLENDSELDEILTMAGELETEDASNDDRWMELVNKINDL